ncbi:uncharacterized protein RSE6_13479 [Rhynchosporium secalis]|uniref:Uncharacterized protein n=1 Tax=Rhynchosporium secalis TaxID=38038 RepID=A0A1E1MT00_RHYSE|nr:uncharacterized protein RSE6_13479 [Rhynchosporium secalis]
MNYSLPVGFEFDGRIGTDNLPDSPNATYAVARGWGPKYLSCDGGDYKIKAPLVTPRHNFAGRIPAFTPPLSNDPEYRGHLAHVNALLDSPVVLSSPSLRHYFESETEFDVFTAGSTGKAKAVPLKIQSDPSVTTRNVAILQHHTPRCVPESEFALDHVVAFELILHGILLDSNVVLVGASEVVSRSGLLLESISCFNVILTLASNFLLARLVKEENRPR